MGWCSPPADRLSFKQSEHQPSEVRAKKHSPESWHWHVCKLLACQHWLLWRFGMPLKERDWTQTGPLREICEWMLPSCKSLWSWTGPLFPHLASSAANVHNLYFYTGLGLSSQHFFFTADPGYSPVEVSSESQCNKWNPLQLITFFFSARMRKSLSASPSAGLERVPAGHILALAVWNHFDCIWLQTQSDLNYYIILLHYDWLLANKTKIKKQLWSKCTMSHELRRLIYGAIVFWESHG